MSTAPGRPARVAHPIRRGRLSDRQAQALVYGLLLGAGGFYSVPRLLHTLRAAGNDVWRGDVDRALSQLLGDGLVVCFVGGESVECDEDGKPTFGDTSTGLVVDLDAWGIA